MPILKKILFLFVILIGLILIIAAFIDKAIEVEESIEINAPVASVWKLTNNLNNINKWNAWFEKDYNMNTVVYGLEGAIGSKFCWDSKKAELRKGCLILAALTTNKSVELLANIYIPYEIHAKWLIHLTPVGNKTKVTLNFKGERRYPFTIMKLWKRAEKSIAQNYITSLEELKKLSESR